MKKLIVLTLILGLFLGCKSKKAVDKSSSYDAKSGATKIVNTLHYPNEKHLKNVKQLTFGGDNAAHAFGARFCSHL